MEAKKDTVISNRYRLEEPVGGGELTSVWRAWDLAGERHCAFKLLRQQFASTSEARARFLLETKIARTVTGRHFATYVGDGSWLSLPFLANSWVKGKSLEHLLAERATLSHVECVCVIDGIARALDELNGADVVHRDVKPSHILIGADGLQAIPTLIDYSVAHWDKQAPVHARHEARTLVGTPAYMSPEQARGSATITGASDRWSLACVAYRCLTGRLPFEGESLQGLLQNITAGRVPEVPAGLNLPSHVTLWLERAFDHDPEQRFSSGVELAEELAAALDVSPGGVLSLALIEDVLADEARAGRDGTNVQESEHAGSDDEVAAPEPETRSTPVAATASLEAQRYVTSTLESSADHDLETARSVRASVGPTALPSRTRVEALPSIVVHAEDAKSEIDGVADTVREGELWDRATPAVDPAELGRAARLADEAVNESTPAAGNYDLDAVADALASKLGSKLGSNVDKNARVSTESSEAVGSQDKHDATTNPDGIAVTRRARESSELTTTPASTLYASDEERSTSQPLEISQAEYESATKRPKGMLIGAGLAAAAAALALIVGSISDGSDSSTPQTEIHAAKPDPRAQQPAAPGPEPEQAAAEPASADDESTSVGEDETQDSAEADDDADLAAKGSATAEQESKAAAALKRSKSVGKPTLPRPSSVKKRRPRSTKSTKQGAVQFDTYKDFGI